MVDYVRSQFEEENTEILVGVGLSLPIIGSVVWSSAGGEWVSTVLGVALTVLGVAFLLGTVVWGTGGETA